MLDWPDERLLAPAPGVSAWSPAHHLYHVAVVNEKIFGGLHQLCIREGDASAEGRANVVGVLLLALGRIPRRRAQAPAAFQPPADLDRDDLRAAVDRSRRALALLEPHVPDIPHVAGRMRHPVLGMLSAPQFLRFSRIHTSHHRAIIGHMERYRPRTPSPAS